MAPRTKRRRIRPPWSPDRKAVYLTASAVYGGLCLVALDSAYPPNRWDNFNFWWITSNHWKHFLLYAPLAGIIGCYPLARFLADTRWNRLWVFAFVMPATTGSILCALFWGQTSLFRLLREGAPLDELLGQAIGGGIAGFFSSLMAFPLMFTLGFFAAYVLKHLAPPAAPPNEWVLSRLRKKNSRRLSRLRPAR